MNRLAALPALIALSCCLAAPAAAADQEQQIGQQVYQQLQQKGEIITNSPLYSVLQPIADRIKTVADPQYQYPFHFILVHEKSPNAFAVPGGNVYVTDSLMHFVENKEELAGVLCHETSHDIHHDVVNNMRKDQNVQMLATLAAILVGHGQNPIANEGIGLAANAQAMTFSRSVETAADLKGSETCAQSGYNPYGMVWLFQKFAKSGQGGSLEMMADHPRDDHRISDLENHFKQNPSLFGTFANDPSKATPLPLPVSDPNAPGTVGPGSPAHRLPPGTVVPYPPSTPRSTPRPDAGTE